jgi:hypothetical protein
MRRESKLQFVSALAIFCLVGHCLGQGTMTIKFEGSPPQPPGTYSILLQYSESGMLFTAPPYTMVLVGSGLSGNPDDGTAHLDTSLNTVITASFPSGFAFSLSSLDVAEQPLAGDLWVVGYREDGSTVTNSFTPASGFQTFHFDSGFEDLSKVQIKGGFAFDNMVVGIPEPSACGLILLGTLSAIGWGHIRRRQRPQGGRS